MAFLSKRKNRKIRLIAVLDMEKIKEYIIFPGDARNNSFNAKQLFDIIVFSGNFVLPFHLL